MTIHKKLIYVFLLFFVLSTCNHLKAQSDSMQIYRQQDLQKVGVAFFNYAKPDKFNFEVLVFGGIRLPGIYFIPEGTSLIELVALTGGAIDESIFDKFKLIRAKAKNPELRADTVMVISYKDFFDKEKVGSISKHNPILKPGDIISFPIKPDKVFWDYAQIITTVFILPLVATATLIVSILNYTK